MNRCLWNVLADVGTINVPDSLVGRRNAMGDRYRKATQTCRVSRKKDFIPAVSSVIKNGWTKPKDLPDGPSATIELKVLGKLEVVTKDTYGGCFGGRNPTGVAVVVMNIDRLIKKTIIRRDNKGCSAHR